MPSKAAPSISDNHGVLKDEARRKAEFNEIAKNLAYWERNAEKWHRRFNLTTEIKKELEKAYQAGLANANATADDTIENAGAQAPVAWVMIPERARGPFDFICRNEWVVLLARNSAAWKSDPDQWACYRDRGEQIKDSTRLEYETAYSPRTLSPLIKLELMSVVEIGNGTRMLEVSDKGWATFTRALELEQILPLD
jgi:hypothetical protein